MHFSLAFFVYVICILAQNVPNIEGSEHRRAAKKNKCLNPPRTARRVESVIEECQEEIKSKMLSEAFQIIKGQMNTPPTTVAPLTLANKAEDLLIMAQNGLIYQKAFNAMELMMSAMVNHMGQERLMHNVRRVGAVTSGIYTPTLVPVEDKRIAGCLLHCVYAKNNAIDKLGWPTLDGLVDFYSEGVNEHGFFMATLRSVNLCLRAVTFRYKVDRRKSPEQGESCDLAFDVFDCISDQITGYCMDHYRQ